MENKRTIIDLFESSVALYGQNTLLLEKQQGEFRPTTYAKSHELVLQIAAGLKTLGIEKGDRISILSEGRNDWILSELGLLYAGGISVPLSIKLEESNDLFFRLEHADVKAIFISGSQVSKLRAIRSKLPLLQHVILFDGESQVKDEITLAELKQKGNDYLREYKNQLIDQALSLDNDDYATITYTSGTTADPKGVILTHRNYTANVEQSLTRITIPPTYRTLIILPLDHCFAHVVGFYIMIHCGASVATVEVGKTPMETLKNIPLNIKEVKPDFLLSVPALAKNFRKNIESGIKSQGAFTEKLFNFALKVSYAYNKDGYSRGSGASFLLKPLVSLFDKVLFSKVRQSFGGNLKFFVGGGALLDAELQRFFYAIGIPMYQGYGLSEATPVISTNSPEYHRFGSSGMLVEPLDIKIKDDQGNDMQVGEKGEIVIRGENVMAGYWKNETSTQETINQGWLYTGDMGYIGTDGFLYVLGRFKSLLIAGDGEKYSPEGMEEAISGISPYIDQVMIYNNQSPFTSALIVPNVDAVKKYAKAHHKHTDVSHAAVALIKAEIDRFRKGGDQQGQFPDRWLPSSFALIGEPFSEKNGLVNSTAKVVRGKVEELYKDRIDYMYTPEGKDVFNPKNLSVFS